MPDRVAMFLPGWAGSIPGRVGATVARRRGLPGGIDAGGEQASSGTVVPDVLQALRADAAIREAVRADLLAVVDRDSRECLCIHRILESFCMGVKSCGGSPYNILFHLSKLNVGMGIHLIQDLRYSKYWDVSSL